MSSSSKTFCDLVLMTLTMILLVTTKGIRLETERSVEVYGTASVPSASVINDTISYTRKTVPTNSPTERGYIMFGTKDTATLSAFAATIRNEDDSFMTTSKSFKHVNGTGIIKNATTVVAKSTAASYKSATLSAIIIENTTEKADDFSHVYHFDKFTNTTMNKTNVYITAKPPIFYVTKSNPSSDDDDDDYSYDDLAEIESPTNTSFYNETSFGSGKKIYSDKSTNKVMNKTNEGPTATPIFYVTKTNSPTNDYDDYTNISFYNKSAYGTVIETTVIAEKIAVPPIAWIIFGAIAILVFISASIAIFICQIKNNRSYSLHPLNDLSSK